MTKEKPENCIRCGEELKFSHENDTHEVYQCHGCGYLLFLPLNKRDKNIGN